VSYSLESVFVIFLYGAQPKAKSTSWITNNYFVFSKSGLMLLRKREENYSRRKESLNGWHNCYWLLTICTQTV
jgi:hypothetical protein